MGAAAAAIPALLEALGPEVAAGAGAEAAGGESALPGMLQGMQFGGAQGGHRGGSHDLMGVASDLAARGGSALSEEPGSGITYR